MNVTTGTLNGRKVWTLDNGTLSLSVTQGGGHIAAGGLHERPGVNPYWTPGWKTIEPWQYRSKAPWTNERALLASLCGHNLCLGWFGGASESELGARMGCHGEAPVARWTLLGKRVSAAAVSFTCGCDLPVAQMAFQRTLTSRRGSHVVEVRERIRSTARRDLPFTMAQHVTLGAPFLEKGVTAFDMPATEAHTFPIAFSERQRLKTDTDFLWPDGPGANGRTVDLRVLGRTPRRSSDFSTQLMDPARRDAWFSAVNPRCGLLLAYQWDRADFPWVGNWEENHGRSESPWNGTALARGMEFANTPFPLPLREAVTLGRFQGQPTFRWLGARAVIDLSYRIILMPVDAKVKGVADITRTETGCKVDLVV